MAQILKYFMKRGNLKHYRDYILEKPIYELIKIRKKLEINPDNIVQDVK